MARFTPKLELFLLKVQSDNTTEATGLTGDDLIEVMEDSSFAYQNDVTEVALVSGAFDQELAVPGKRTAEVTLKVPLRNFGAADSEVKPDFGELLRCSGFEESTSTSNYYVYTPDASEGKSATVWMYDGLGDGASTNLYKAFNLKGGAWKISGEVGKIATLEVPMMGGFSDFTVGTMPTVTRNRTIVPALLNMTMTINGVSTYKILNFEIDGGQTVEVDTDGAAASGSGQSSITDRKMKMTATVYADIQSSIDPINALESATEGAMALYWNNETTPEIKLDAGYTQITSATRSESNGKTTFDLELQLNRNDFSISVLGNATA